MKKLLTLLTFGLLIGTVHAQMITDKKVFEKSTTKSLAKKVQVAAGDGQIWWSNYDLNEDAGWFLMGTDKAEHYNVATYIPYNFIGGAGTTIAGFSFFPITSQIDNVKVWVSKTLPAFGEEADLETVSVGKSNITINNFNDVAFTKAHEIPEGGLYVGYSFDVTALTERYSGNPFLYTNTDANREKGCLYSTTSSTEWTEGTGNALVKVLFGGSIYQNAARFHDFGSSCVLKNDKVSVAVKLSNLGTDDVSTIAYKVMSEGKEIDQGTANVTCNGIQSSTTAYITLKADAEPVASVRELIITEVNGYQNEATWNKASGKLITIETAPEVVPVVEEFTGTWCGYCPYGMVGMSKAYETYGDKVALIAAHSGDVMAISDYDPILSGVNSFPNAFLNRDSEFYPSSGTILRYIKNAMTKVVPGAVKAVATWTDDNKKMVSIDTKTTFQYNDNDGKYGLAYVIVADGLKGTTSAWNQSNYLSGESGDSEMQFWYDSPSKVSGVEYNHVAIAARDILNGVEGSVNPSIKAGETQSFTYQVDLSSNLLAQDKSKLKAIVLLIEKETGKIVNAAISQIGDPSAAIAGDINGDGEVNVTDVVTLINYIARNDFSGVDKNTLDMNGDGEVNVTDVVTLILMIGKG